MNTTLTLEIDYNPGLTDPETLAAALDRLLANALSTPGIMEEHGNPAVGAFVVATNDASHHRTPPDAEPCDCEDPGGAFYSGVPGILAAVRNGRLIEGAAVERCDQCRRYPRDEAARAKLVDLGIAPPTDANKIDNPEVVINLSGGMVQEVYASGTLGDLTVVDWDVGCGDEGYTEVLHRGEPLRAYVAHPIIYALDRLTGSPTQAVIDAADRERLDAPTG